MARGTATTEGFRSSDPPTRCITPPKQNPDRTSATGSIREPRTIPKEINANAVTATNGPLLTDALTSIYSFQLLAYTMTFRAHV